MSVDISAQLQEVLSALLAEAKKKGATGSASGGVFDNRGIFTKTSQRVITGDGWAYDIVLAGWTTSLPRA